MAFRVRYRAVAVPIGLIGWFPHDACAGGYRLLESGIHVVDGDVKQDGGHAELGRIAEGAGRLAQHDGRAADIHLGVGDASVVLCEPEGLAEAKSAREPVERLRDIPVEHVRRYHLVGHVCSLATTITRSATPRCGG